MKVPSNFYWADYSIVPSSEMSGYVHLFVNMCTGQSKIAKVAKDIVSSDGFILKEFIGRLKLNDKFVRK